MGDRGNIFFVDRREGDALVGVYMYTHWSGSVLPGVVRDALIRGRGRWGDSQYLARIVFCELVKEAILEETGYGLGTYIGDNEHNVVRVDDVASRVSFHEPGNEQRSGDPGLASWSYEEFVAAQSAAVERAFRGEPAAEAGEAERSPKGKVEALPRAQVAPKANGKGKRGAAAKSNGHAAEAPRRGGKAKVGTKAHGTKAPRSSGSSSGKRSASGSGKGKSAAPSGGKPTRRRAGTK